MTDPDPEVHETGPPARRRLLVGRLAAAVRRQDRVTVLVEITIVVLGVVIGFQVTAWGQDRTDRQRERSVLRQLAADLAETERIMADRNAGMAATTEYAIPRLLQAYGQPGRPPKDSLVNWLYRIKYVASPRPITGTAEAIVASGDFGAVRDDSLRAAILRYLDTTRERLADQERFGDLAWEDIRSMSDYTGGWWTLADAEIDIREGYFSDALIYQDADTTGLAASPDWVAPFQPDPEALLDNEALLRVAGPSGAQRESPQRLPAGLRRERSVASRAGRGRAPGWAAEPVGGGQPRAAHVAPLSLGFGSAPGAAGRRSLTPR